MYYTILVNTKKKIYEVLSDTPDYWFTNICNIQNKLHDFTYDIHMIDDEYTESERKIKKDEIINKLIDSGYKEGLVHTEIITKKSNIKN